MFAAIFCRASIMMNAIHWWRRSVRGKTTEPRKKGSSTLRGVFHHCRDKPICRVLPLERLLSAIVRPYRSLHLRCCPLQSRSYLRNDIQVDRSALHLMTDDAP